MYQERILGYDYREMWMRQIDVYTSQERDQQLLNSHITDLFSANPRSWKSKFEAYIARKTNPISPDIQLPIPLEHRTEYDFWNDLQAMQKAYVDSTYAYMPICISVVMNELYERLLEWSSQFDFPGLHSVIWDPVPDTVQPAWTLLGYDVQDRLLTHDISDYFPSEIQLRLREAFGDHINQYNLFHDIDAASAYGEEYFRLEPHDRYMVCALYKIT